MNLQLLAFACACLTSVGLGPVPGALTLAQEKGAEALKFDEVFVAKSSIDLLYVVLTDPKPDHPGLVVKYAQAALREAADHRFKGTTSRDEKPDHDGNVVFVIRRERADQLAAYTGFSVDQLQEIVAAGPEKGRSLAARHAWALGEVRKRK